ncbi:MAG: hypothetical protein ACOY4D_02015 [Pseudomonadota bacterium]
MRHTLPLGEKLEKQMNLIAGRINSFRLLYYLASEHKALLKIRSRREGKAEILEKAECTRSLPLPSTAF